MDGSVPSLFSPHCSGTIIVVIIIALLLVLLDAIVVFIAISNQNDQATATTTTKTLACTQRKQHGAPVHLVLVVIVPTGFFLHWPLTTRTGS